MMEIFLLVWGDAVRVSVLIGMLAMMTVWESLVPRRVPVSGDGRWQAMRKVSNLAVMVVGAVAVRLVFPLLGSAVAVVTAERGWGIFNMVSLPWWSAMVVCFVILDLVIYFQHRMFHSVPLLWRLHRMHHADTDIDVTTGVRFHPLEMVVSMAIKLAVVIVIGAPVAAVILFECVLNATSLFNHANIALPRGVDLWLRRIVVTPDMHRVHHSWHGQETDSNFGFNLPWWDRLFGTYTAESQDGREGITVGLPAFRSRRDARIDKLLIQPFEREGNRHVG